MYANDVVIEQEGYARKLSRTSRRLDLLRYDCVSAESMYKKAALKYMDSGFAITLPFEAYRNAVKKIDISNPDSCVVISCLQATAILPHGTCE